jgi:DnaJ-class molecular chaperone
MTNKKRCKHCTGHGKLYFSQQGEHYPVGEEDCDACGGKGYTVQHTQGSVRLEAVEKMEAVA